MSEDEQAATSAEGRKGRRGAATARRDDDETPVQIAEAHSTYTSAMFDALKQADPTARGREAYADYVRAATADWTPERMAERYAEGARAYVRAMAGYLDPEQDNLEAYRTYIAEVAEQWWPEAARTRAREAYQNYLDGLGDALDPSPLERASEQAWGEYIGKLQDACKQLDGKADPAVVAALAQSALAAATLMRSVRTVLAQRAAARERVAAPQRA